jgi:hypothetical protein
MLLHQNKIQFESFISITANYYCNKYSKELIEKDYYNFIVLKRIAQENPYTVFKGGTSLSKAYGIINRLSEDMDITLDKEHITKGNKKRLSESIVSTLTDYCNEPDCGKLERTGSYNRFISTYDSLTGSNGQYIKVEEAFRIPEFPYEEREITCYITEYMRLNGLEKGMIEFGLEPFKMNTVSVQRTFIDKLFALGDYYLSYKNTGNEKKISAKSRHIYDIYKIISVDNLIHIDNNLVENINSIRVLRRDNSTACLSSHDDINIVKLLIEILETDVYKSDFNKITVSSLYSEEVTYEMCKSKILEFLNELSKIYKNI